MARMSTSIPPMVPRRRQIKKGSLNAMKKGSINAKS